MTYSRSCPPPFWLPLYLRAARRAPVSLKNTPVYVHALFGCWRRSGDETAFALAEAALDAPCLSHALDQLSGGFYSDPIEENAPLTQAKQTGLSAEMARALAEGWLIAGHPRYERAARLTLGWLERALDGTLQRRPTAPPLIDLPESLRWCPAANGRGAIALTEHLEHLLPDLRLQTEERLKVLSERADEPPVKPSSSRELTQIASAFARCGVIFGERRWTTRAITLIEQLAPADATHSPFMLACLELYKATSDLKWLGLAHQLAALLIAQGLKPEDSLPLILLSHLSGRTDLIPSALALLSQRWTSFAASPLSADTEILAASLAALCPRLLVIQGDILAPQTRAMLREHRSRFLPFTPCIVVSDTDELAAFSWLPFLSKELKEPTAWLVEDTIDVHTAPHSLGEALDRFKGPDPVPVLTHPSRIALLANRIYISDTGHNRIIEAHYTLGPDGWPRARLLRCWGISQEGQTDGDIHHARFNQPIGLAVDRATLWVGDAGNRRLRTISLDTGETLTFAQNPPNAAPSPWAVAIAKEAAHAAASAIFFTMRGEHQVLVAFPEGKLASLAGCPEAGTEDGDLRHCRLNQPSGLTYSEQLLYVVEGNGSIRKFDLETQAVTTLFSEKNRQIAPFDLAIDGDTLWRVDPLSGTLWAHPIASPSSTKPYLEQLDHPSGLCCTEDFIWLVESHKDRIILMRKSDGRRKTLRWVTKTA